MRETRIDPAIWRRFDMRAALSVRDIGAVYRLLQKHGVSQRRIAAMAGQSQSEISEILGGRQVTTYDVLVRIADGLGVPRGHLGLAHDTQAPTTADDEQLRPTTDEASGRWVVRMPVYFDSYAAAQGLCEALTATSADMAVADQRDSDDTTPRRWYRAVESVLSVSAGLAKQAS